MGGAGFDAHPAIGDLDGRGQASNVTYGAQGCGERAHPGVYRDKRGRPYEFM
jgi:hypothetical protein